MVGEKKSDGTWEVDGLQPWQETYKQIIKMLLTDVPFKFARYGDGEIFCMDGKVGHNCDHHEYFPDLGLALHEAVKNANYMVGLQPLSIFENHNIDYFRHLNLYNADVLHNASIKKDLQKFFDALWFRRVILVGPEYLSSLDLDSVHIKIPRVNCWQKFDDVCSFIKVEIDFWKEKMNEPSVVLLCASMMSEVIIDKFRDSDSTFIDCGSVFDPYAGVRSRRYHQKLEI